VSGRRDPDGVNGMTDTRFLQPEKLPMAPGTSPFRMKGHVYRGVLEHLDTVVPGGTYAVRTELRDSNVRAFFEQSFLPSGWYDILPSLPLVVTSARLAAIPFLQLARQVARAQAARDIHGIYRFVLKLSSPDMVISRMSRATAQYFDFGSTELKTLSQGHAILERTGVPAPLVGFYCGLTEGFVMVALEMTGAKDVKVRPSRPVRDGERSGVETMTIPFDVRWQ
jgi:hypothetical protein